MKIKTFLSLFLLPISWLSAEENLFVFNGVFDFQGEVKVSLTHKPTQHTRWVTINQSFHQLKLVDYEREAKKLKVVWEESTFWIPLEAPGGSRWASREAAVEPTGRYWETAAFRSLPLLKQWELLERYSTTALQSGDDVVDYFKKRNDLLGTFDAVVRGVEPVRSETDSEERELPSAEAVLAHVTEVGPPIKLDFSQHEIYEHLSQLQLFDIHTHPDWPIIQEALREAKIAAAEQNDEPSF